MFLCIWSFHNIGREDIHLNEDVGSLHKGFPDSPVGNRIRALAQASQTESFSEKDYEEHFTETAQKRQPPPEIYKMAFSSPDLLVEAISPHELFLTLTLPGFGQSVVLVEVESAPPYRISKAAGQRKLEGGAAGTSINCAIGRAIHNRLDDPIFEDPLAERLLSQEDRMVLEMVAARGGTTSLPTEVVVPRLVEDNLISAMDRGVGQYVVLGAGLDSFPYRRQDLVARLRVFEVDRPETQKLKRTRLSEEKIEEPENLSFVPVNFESTDFLAELERAGFRRQQPAFFSWVNVTWYLSRAAIESTLKNVATCAPGTEIVFNYEIPEEMWDEEERELFSPKLCAKVGEPIVSSFTSEEIEALLLRSGFSQVEDFGPKDLSEMYLSGRTDSLRVSSATRVARALV